MSFSKENVKMNSKLRTLKEKDLWERVGSFQGLHSAIPFTNLTATLPKYIYQKSGLVTYLKALFTRPAFLLGFTILLIIIFGAIIAPEVSNFDFRGKEPASDELGEISNWLDEPFLGVGDVGRAGSETHLIGTDSFGADLWSQIWYGTRNTLAITSAVVFATLVVGGGIGLIIGYFRLADWFFQRIIKILSNIPTLLILALLSTIFGRTIEGLIIAFILLSWLAMALQVRAQVFRVRNLDYNKASRIMGSSTLYIFMRNVFPATLPIVVTNIMFIIPSTILSEATLGFIGLSLDPLKATTLGTIISRNSDSLVLHPGILVAPALVLFLITLATQLMGDVVNKVNREGAR